MKILKNSFIYVMLGFLPMGINFLLAPLYSHILNPEQNALLGQAAILQAFLIVFLSLSLDGAFRRLYFDYYKDPDQLKKLTSSLLLFLLGIGLFAFLVMIAVGNNILLFFQKNQAFTFSKYGIWVFLTSWCTIIQSVFLAYYRNEEKAVSFSVLSLIFFFSSLAFTLIGLLVFKAEALGSIAGRAIAYIIVTIIFLFIFFNKMGFAFRFKYVRESLKFSLPVVPYLLLMVLYGNIDRILIERYFSLTDLGIYNFAFLISGAISVFITSGQNVLAPIVYRLLGEETINEKKVNDLYKWFHYINTGIISIALAIAIIFIQVFISIQYQSITNYIGVLFLSYIFRVYYIIYVDALFYFKKTKWVFLITLVSFLVGLLSNIFLIPAFGILGVCISVMIINLVQAAGALVQLRLYHLNMNFYRFPGNHFYTACILASYLTMLFVFRYMGMGNPGINYIPLLITAVFSIFFLYQNKSGISEKIREMKKTWPFNYAKRTS